MAQENKNDEALNALWETEDEEDDTKYERRPDCLPGELTDDQVSEAIRKYGELFDAIDPAKLKYHTGASLALIKLGSEDYGLVEDTNNEIMWVPGQGQIVGTWTFSRVDKLIHLKIMTPINALEDKAIANYAHWLADRERKESKKTPTPGASATRRAVKDNSRQAALPSVPEAIQKQEQERSKEFNSLRAKLFGSKPKK